MDIASSGSGTPDPHTPDPRTPDFRTPDPRAPDARRWQALLDGLPVPAVVVAVRPGWPVIAVSRGFGDAARGEAAPDTALADLLGTTWLRGDADALVAALAEVAEAGARRVLPLAGRSAPQPGERRAPRWEATLQPLPGDTGEDGAVLVALGRDDAAATSVVLRDLSLAFGDPGGTGFDAALHAALTATGARRGVVLCSEQGAPFRVVASAGPPAAAAEPGGPVPDEVPLEEVALDEVAVDDLDSPLWDIALGRAGTRWDAAGDERPPVPFAGAPGWEHLLVAGLRVRGRDAAVLVVAEPVGGAFDDGALERLELVAVLAGTATENQRLLDDLARLADLLRAAVDTTAALVEATEPATVRRRLLSGLHRDVGLEAAVLWVPDEDGGLRLSDEEGLPPAVRERLATLPAASLAARLLRGRSRSVRGSDVARTVSDVWGGRRVHLVRVPSPAPGVLGVYVDRSLPALVDEVLATIGHALAAAVHQTTLHTRARTVVDSLQRQLRPREVPLPADADRGHVYQSATAGVDVGGDFFDVFLTDTGHVGLVCGDVSGKGVEAASLTAMAVYSLRAFALPGTTPQVAVAMLNGTVCAQTPDERFMTLAYARIDPVEWTVELTVAGHPPPIVVDRDGARVHDVLPDVPVGLDPVASFSQHELRLAAGESLVLHTDGVTEARRGERGTGELLGVERLVAALHGLGDLGAQEIADRVWDVVQDWTGGGTTDDCAIVVLRRGPAAGSARPG